MVKIFLAICISLMLIMQDANAEPLRVGINEDLAPFSFSQNGTSVGIDVDMLNEAARRLHLEVKIQLMPFKRIIQSLENGDIQAGGSLFHTSERDAFAIFAAPLDYSTYGLFVHKGKEFKFDSVDDLIGKRLGINRGFVVQDDLYKAIKSGKVFAEEVSTVHQNISKLIDDRIDAFPYNVVSMQYIIKGTVEQKEITILPKMLIEKRPAYLAFSKAANIPNKEQVISSLTATMEKMYQDGTYDMIVNKYVK